MSGENQSNSLGKRFERTFGPVLAGLIIDSLDFVTLGTLRHHDWNVGGGLRRVLYLFCYGAEDLEARTDSDISGAVLRDATDRIYTGRHPGGCDDSIFENRNAGRSRIGES